MFALLDKLLKPYIEKVDKLASQLKAEQEARGKAMAEVEELCKFYRYRCKEHYDRDTVDEHREHC